MGKMCRLICFREQSKSRYDYLYDRGWPAKVETTFDSDTVWLSIDQMAELFQRDCSVIGKHVRNIDVSI